MSTDRCFASAKQITFLEHRSAMCGALAAMPESERRALSEWETTHIDGSGRFGTSDWPGWEKYIGLKPVIVISRSTYRKQYIPLSLRLAVLRRDGCKCVDCGSTDRLEMAHVIAERDGGPLTIENLRTKCHDCHVNEPRRPR